MERSKKTSTRRPTKQEYIEKQLGGAKSDAAGLRYEQNVLNYFSTKGWQNLQIRKKKYGYEYDIYGQYEPFMGTIKYLLAECKTGERVSAKDIVRFMAKVDVFCRHIPVGLFLKPDVQVYLCHRGIIDPDAEKVAKAHKPSIKFKKM